MHNIYQLEKQQVGLRLPRYLLEEIEIQKIYAEELPSITLYYPKWYWAHNQKANIFYNDFDKSCKELKTSLSSNSTDSIKSLDELINELEH